VWLSRVRVWLSRVRRGLVQGAAWLSRVRCGLVGCGIVPGRLFFAAPQRIAITSSPKYYQKMQHSITRKNQEEHGPEVK
jgi:hypothetical protein